MIKNFSSKSPYLRKPCVLQSKHQFRQVCNDVKGNDDNKQIYRRPGWPVVWGPFTRLPNIRRFEIKLGILDPLFEYFGVKKRLKPTIKFHPFENNSLNRYAYFQLKKLGHLKNEEAYWNIVNHLMRNSITFYLMSLRSVKPAWHRDYKFTTVIGWYFAVRKLARQEYSELKCSRVYIPKGEGKGMRPLGVPTVPWRIYLNMMNQFIVLRWDKHIPLSQHGYRPGMGTLTLWREVLEKVIHSNDIFEFDLKKCFDTINIYYGYSLFQYLGMPKYLNRKLFIINASRIRGPLISKDESLAYERQIKDMLWKGGNAAEILISRGIPMQRYSFLRGYAQGTPTSAFLSIISMVKPLMLRDIPGKCVLGADDGLYYGNLCEKRYSTTEVDAIIDGKPNTVGWSFTPLMCPNTEMVKSNIEFSVEKSGWVKAGGKWYKTLKLWGLVYDPFKDKLYSKTRSGQSLEFDKKDLVAAVKSLDEGRENSPGRIKGESGDWKSLIRSKIWGFIVSRMYNGGWNMENFLQNFDLTFRSGSWCEENLDHVEEHMTVFNSTSFAIRGIADHLKRINRNKSKRGMGRADVSRSNRITSRGASKN